MPNRPPFSVLSRQIQQLPDSLVQQFHLVRNPDRMIVYTDGSCTRNPGGSIGSAFIAVTPSGRILSGKVGWASGTNQQAEALAVLHALENLPTRYPVTLFTDSMYCIYGLARLQNPEACLPKANKTIWKAIEAALKPFQDFRAVWVKGHSGIAGNELADGLADEVARHGPYESPESWKKDEKSFAGLLTFPE